MQAAVSVLAILVLGPAHGTQVAVPEDHDVFLVAEQPELRDVLNARQAEDKYLPTVHVHRYQRTRPLFSQRDAYIYEHMGRT